MLKPFYQEKLLEAGCDEAGRGCYAGPVFAAAVILPKDFRHPLLNDSKQLSEKHRDALRPVIEKEAIAFAVASVSNEEIDQINILKASFKAMHLALDNFKKKQFPQYGWDKNKGYGTLVHRKAIEEFGLCKFHRKSFRLTAEQPALF